MSTGASWATTAASTSWLSTTAGRSRRRCSGSPASRTPRRPSGSPTAKSLIFEGFQTRRRRRRPARRRPALLVDEQFGAAVARNGKASGYLFAMPVEKSGQDEFDFQYGDDFGEAHRRLRPHVLEGARAVEPRRRTRR